MKEKEIRTIGRDVYLQAKGLFALAQMHAAKVKEFEQGLHDLLGYEEEGWPYCGHISDELYGSGQFEPALKKEGFVVSSLTKKPAKRSKRENR